MLAAACHFATAMSSPAQSATASMIERIDPSHAPGWDNEIARLPGASFFHGATWSRVMQQTYGYQPCYLVLRDKDTVEGVLPLMEVNSPLTGRRGISLPFTDACAPLVAGQRSGSILFDSALNYGRERKWRSVEVRGGNLPQGAEPSLSFLSHHLALTDSEADLFGRFDASVRRAIRKSESAGLKVEAGNDVSAMSEFYRLVSMTRKRHGLPPQPLRFFEALHQHVIAPRLGHLALVRRGAVAIAGAVFLRFGPTAVYKFGASDERFQEYRANNLVMWDALRRYAALGCRTFDFGRTSLRNEGLRRFKLGWGTTEMPLHYIKYDFKKDRFIRERDEASGWHNAVFRFLPRPVSRFIGTLLYPHVA
jgi:hypothetical protein